MLHDDHDHASAAAGWNTSDYAHHLTRRARGLPFWFSLATYGTDAYAAAIETTLRTARDGARLVDEAEHLELILEPELSIVLFRRPGWTAADYQSWSDEQLRRGEAFVTPTTWQGRDGVALVHRQPGDDHRGPRRHHRIAGLTSSHQPIDGLDTASRGGNDCRYRFQALSHDDRRRRQAGRGVDVQRVASPQRPARQRRRGDRRGDARSRLPAIGAGEVAEVRAHRHDRARRPRRHQPVLRRDCQGCRVGGPGHELSARPVQHGRELAREHSVLSTIRDRVDGLLLAPARDDAETSESLADLGVPIVLVDRTLPDPGDADAVLIDNAGGAAGRGPTAHRRWAPADRFRQRSARHDSRGRTPRRLPRRV